MFVEEATTGLGSLVPGSSALHGQPEQAAAAAAQGGSLPGLCASALWDDACQPLSCCVSVSHVASTPLLIITAGC